MEPNQQQEICLMPEFLSDGAPLYLDLMKHCLTDSVYAADPLANFVPYKIKPGTPRWKRIVVRALQKMLKPYRIELVEAFSTPGLQDYSALSAEELVRIRDKGSAWPARAHTMIGLTRLSRLQHCVETVIREDVSGDLIETGVWRGGACILMRAILKAHRDTARKVWVAASFAGLPPPNADDYPADAGDTHHTYSDVLAISRQQVESNFAHYGLLDEQVHFLEGWFKDTLPAAPITQIAVLRLDGDMYESTIQVLDALYDKLSPGVFVIVDDYELAPCAQAIHDFREVRGITDPIDSTDGTPGSFWRRSS
jgi:O-methyltransferase